MRIGVDVFPLSRPCTGMSTYILNIIKNLEKIDKENEYFLYSYFKINLPFQNNVRWHIRPMYGIINKSSTLWFLLSAHKCLINDKIDVFWGTQNIFPIRFPKYVKKILTVHDIIRYRCVKNLDWKNAIIQGAFLKMSIETADKIITASQSTVKDIKWLLDSDEKDITLIYDGIATEEFKSYNKLESTVYIANKFQVSKKYILSVGTVADPRKNFDTLIKAFAILAKQHMDFSYQLLIVGGKIKDSPRAFKAYRICGLSEAQVKFLGYVEKVDLIRLYSGASLFVLPSLYEGFGLPLLEAMACGCPVVSSNTSSLPEVCGDAAILVDPLNVQQIASAMYDVLTNQELRNTLIQKGLERAKMFSWEKAAKETLEVFEKFNKI